MPLPWQVIAYLHRGTLPWQGLRAPTKKQRYEMICETKMTTRSAELLRGLPHEYQLTMDYIKVRSIDPFSRFLEKSLWL